MIDRNARTQLAAALERLVSGEITNDEFEDGLPPHMTTSRDAGVRAVFDAAWRLYDDGREYRLEGPSALSDASRKEVTRWLDFLRADLEYEWREPPAWFNALFVLPNLLSLGLLGRWVWRRVARQGEAEVWPFIRRSDR